RGGPGALVPRGVGCLAARPAQCRLGPRRRPRPPLPQPRPSAPPPRTVRLAPGIPEQLANLTTVGDQGPPPGLPFRAAGAGPVARVLRHHRQSDPLLLHAQCPPPMPPP